MIQKLKDFLSKHTRREIGLMMSGIGTIGFVIAFILAQAAPERGPLLAISGVLACVGLAAYVLFGIPGLILSGGIVKMGKLAWSGLKGLVVGMLGSGVGAVFIPVVALLYFMLAFAAFFVLLFLPVIPAYLRYAEKEGGDVSAPQEGPRTQAETSAE